MTFQNPAFLPLGLSVAVLVVLALWSHARRRRRLAVFLGGSRAARRLARSDLYRLRLERIVLLSLATLAVAGAAAEPTWREADRPEPVRSVILAIDLSASMQASDVSPTRLARAIEVADGLLAALGSDRAGLLLFAGSAYPLAPLTPDNAALRYFLTGVTPTMASAHDPGTLLALGIREAAELWITEPDPYEERSIILISDGDTAEPEGAVLAAARAAAEGGIRVHAIGVGTEAGGEMLMPTAPYQLGGPVLDERGAAATSRLNRELLERVAEASGGRYAHLDDGAALAALRRSLQPGQDVGPWWARHDHAFLLILLALAGLLLESLLDLRLPGLPVGSLWRRTA